MTKDFLHHFALEKDVDIPSSSASSVWQAGHSTESSGQVTPRQETYLDIEACLHEKTVDGDQDVNANPGSGVLGSLVTRTLSRSSTRDLGPPPDGGWLAWLQVVMTFLVLTNTWGVINSFGVFQTYYTTTLSRQPSDISWIGSVQVFLLFFIGTFTGRIADAGYFRQIFCLGTILTAIAMFMTSLSTKYWQLFLAQGVCLGLGNGCLFCPSMSILSTYFTTKKSLAIGLATTGSGLGGVIYPAMVQQLLPRIGYGWTIRTMAFIQFGCLIICSFGTKPRTKPRTSREIVDWASFKELPYLFYATGMFFNFWGLYFAYYYIGSFSRDIIGVSYSQSINLLIIMNGAGLLGRTIPGFLADRYFGPLNTILFGTFCTVVTLFGWIGVRDRAGTYAWSIVYGIASAIVQALFPATLSSLTTDLRKSGVRMGQVFTIVSFACLTGPSIGGQLVQLKNGEYLYAQIFAGISILVSMGFLAAAKMTKSGDVLGKV
ncbi:major facilitator superfamily domain-containing protein [Xylogone sp. PMI_703]|nr:major facilitator superfamily domain-containing protein [Xylogone sp. PMI_703]